MRIAPRAVIQVSTTPEHQNGDDDFPVFKGAFRAIILFGAFLVVATWLTNAWVDAWHARQPLERRNVHFRRGWVDHVLSPERRDQADSVIVIISNSQGYGREVPDDVTYASRLEKGLSERQGGKVRVLNWSIPAGRGPEFVVLGAAVARVNPDILLMVSGPSNFQRSWMVLDQKTGQRKNWVSDCYQLVGFEPIRGNMPESFMAHFFRPIDHVEIFLARAWTPWRYREIVVSKLMLDRDWWAFDKAKHQEKWFYQPYAPGEQTNRIDRPGIVQEDDAEDLKPDSISWELLAHYGQAVQASSARKIYVSMPLHSTLRENQAGLTQAFRDRFTVMGHQYVDLSDKVPDQEFLSLTHFNDKGHATMATLLVKALAP